MSVLTVRRRSLARSYGYTTLFCVAIAALLWALEPANAFWRLLVVSLCIGLSIATAFELLEPPLQRWMSPYVAPVPITLVGLTGGLLLGGWLLGNPGQFFLEALDTWALGIFFGVVGFLLVSTRERLQTLRTALARAEAERLNQEKVRLETELRLLQAQIEPHFLFNTLSNIASMIRSQPEAAERTITDLTTLLRASLKRTRASFASVGDELDIVRSYLSIQKIRMGDRLDWEIHAAPDLATVPLPPLLLQPLVENAVRHGIEHREAGGTIRIDVRREAGGLRIAVADDGPGIADPNGIGHDVPGAGGTGIRNVLERLHALYDGQAGLTFETNADGGLTAVVHLPDDHAHRSAR